MPQVSYPFASKEIPVPLETQPKRTTETRRLRVLAIAYACNPTRGSEFGVGWGWVKAIASNHDVTVITAGFNSTDIKRELALDCSNTSDHPQFIFAANQPWHYRPTKTWLKIESSIAKPLKNLVYQDWLKHAFAEAKSEIVRNHYDLVHLITYVGWRFPGKFYQLGIPFVWGPVGGLANTPWRLFPALGLKGTMYYAARNIINSLQLKVLQGPRRALRQAQGSVIAGTSEIQSLLLHHFGSTSRVICEVGAPSAATVEPRSRRACEPLKIGWSGLHLPGKALHLLLHAAASLSSDTSFSLRILGNGPSNSEWRALAQRLGIDGRCRWYGNRPRDEALSIMESCDVFVITSLKELTSTVAIEALSLGIPIVSLDHCGYADLVTDECGIKIQIESVSQMICDLARALKRLGQDEDLRLQLAQGALRRSRNYSWKNKMDDLNDLYSEAVKQIPFSQVGPPSGGIV